MAWAGKIIGGTIGFIIGGPVGWMMGTVFGHQLDSRQNTRQPASVDTAPLPGDLAERTAFIHAAFPVMGYIAKADGRVSPEEIENARRIIHRLPLTQSQQRLTMNCYEEGKRSDFRLDTTVDAWRSHYSGGAPVLRLFMELQLEAAITQGQLIAVKEHILLQLCERLGFSRYEFYGMKTRLLAQQQFEQFIHSRQYESHRHHARNPTAAPDTRLADAYRTLGVAPGVPDDEIKRAYRRLVSRHHPDKLVAQDVPEHVLKSANDETQKIQKAYDTICRHRNP